MKIKPNELNYDHYPNKVYDDSIGRSIPGHKDIHRNIEEIIRENYSGKSGLKITELGVGTGVTADAVLQYVPNSFYTGIDFSKNMLKGAQVRLAKYKNIELIAADFAEIELPKENDLAISVIGIHHQESDDDKKSLFKKIYDSLKIDGAFIFGDLVTYNDKEKAALNEALHYHHLVQNASDEKSLREWAYHHKFQNKLAPLEDQVDWLKDVGFRKVDVIYQKFNTALIYAEK